MDNIIMIDGHQITLIPFSKMQEKALWFEAKWTFDFFFAALCEQKLVAVLPKNGTSYTPLQLEKYEHRLAEKFKQPIVFLLPSLSGYQRLRLSERGLYFIIPDKNALLPFFFANRKTSDRAPATMLTSMAQQLLLSEP